MSYQSQYTGAQIDEAVKKAGKAIVTPDTAPSSVIIPSVDTNNTQVNLTLGEGLGINEGVLSTTGVSWGDIVNKPFEGGGGDTFTTPTLEELQLLVATGELVLLDFEGGSIVQVSKNVLTIGDFANGYTLTIGVGEEAESVTIPAEDVGNTVFQLVDGVLAVLELAFISVDQQAVGVDISGITFPETGLYVLWNAITEVGCLSITLPGSDAFGSEKLKLSALPKHSHEVEDLCVLFAGSSKVEFDAATYLENYNNTGYGEYPVSVVRNVTTGEVLGASHVRVSGAVPTLEDFKNGCTICVTGDQYITIPYEEVAELYQDGVFNVDTVLFIIDKPYTYTIETTTLSAYFPEPGVYFSERITALEIPGYTGFKDSSTCSVIDSKYLPNATPVILQLSDTDTTKLVNPETGELLTKAELQAFIEQGRQMYVYIVVPDSDNYASFYFCPLGMAINNDYGTLVVCGSEGLDNIMSFYTAEYTGE